MTEYFVDQVAANVHAGDVINVYATGDTTWRVVFYGCQDCSVP
jgi:hypothetical protein